MPGRLARMRSTSSQNWRRDRGSTPVVGSSRIKQVRIVDQGAAQAELLLHAAGQLAGRPVGEAAQPDTVQQLGDAALALGSAEAEQPGEEVGVLEDRQRRVEVLAQALRHVGDARAGRPAKARVRHVAAEHLDPPLLDAAGAGDQRQQAGFADAVRADQPDHAAGWQIEGDAIERVGLAVPQADISQSRHRRRIGWTDALAVRSAYRGAHRFSSTSEWAGEVHADDVRGGMRSSAGRPHYCVASASIRAATAWMTDDGRPWSNQSLGVLGHGTKITTHGARVANFCDTLPSSPARRPRPGRPMTMVSAPHTLRLKRSPFVSPFCVFFRASAHLNGRMPCQGRQPGLSLRNVSRRPASDDGIACLSAGVGGPRTR